MELEQTGDKVTGHYARYGPVKIDGNISGRRLDFHTTWLRNSKGWFDLSKDGKKIEGAAVADGTNAWYGWQGRARRSSAGTRRSRPGRSWTARPRT